MASPIPLDTTAVPANRPFRFVRPYDAITTFSQGQDMMLQILNQGVVVHEMLATNFPNEVAAGFANLAYAAQSTPFRLDLPVFRSFLGSGGIEDVLTPIVACGSMRRGGAGLGPGEVPSSPAGV